MSAFGFCEPLAKAGTNGGRPQKTKGNPHFRRKEGAQLFPWPNVFCEGLMPAPCIMFSLVAAHASKPQASPARVRTPATLQHALVLQLGLPPRGAHTQCAYSLPPSLLASTRSIRMTAQQIKKDLVPLPACRPYPALLALRPRNVLLLQRHLRIWQTTTPPRLTGCTHHGPPTI